MFIRPAPSEILHIVRGLLVLMLIIIAGVVAAESQINSLTQRQDCVQVLNIKRDGNGGYSAYFFGQVYHVQAVYPIAKILNQDHEMIIRAGSYQIMIPTEFEKEIIQARQQFMFWLKPIAGEAFRYKLTLQRDIEALAAKIAEYVQNLR